MHNQFMKVKQLTTLLFILTFFLSITIFPSASSAKQVDVINNGSAYYGENQVGVFTVNGDTAFCVQHEKLTPPDHSANKGEQVYHSENIRRALYYGWDGPKNIFGHDRDRGYVVTSLVLSRLYTGESAGGQDIPGYDKLWNLAHHGHVPTTTFKFSDHKLSVSVKGNKQVSQSVTLNADTGNSVTFHLPEGLHLYNEATKHDDTGKVIVKGKQKFHLWAGVQYSKKWNSGRMTGSQKPFQSLLIEFNYSRYQTVTRSGYLDPPKTEGISATFFTRQATLNYKLIDKHNKKILQKGSKKYTIGKVYDYRKFAKDFNGNGKKGHKGTHYDYDTYHGKTSKGSSISLHHKMPSNNVTLTFYYIPQQHERYSEINQYNHDRIFKKFDVLKNVGHHFSYTPDQQVNKSKNIYDLISKYPWTGTLGYKNVSHNFYYVLRRQVTVNYLDLRTGKPIRSAKTYMKHQGDAYSESHPAIKTKDGTAYHYVKATGAKQSGKIGTDNITINYYYELPLMQVGVKKLQIYTAPADQGLPVRVQLEHKDFYGESLADMGKKTIHVSLYRGTKRLNTQKYTARAFPDQTTFKISSNSGLQVNEHQKYTIKLDGYNQYDFSLIPKEEQLTTDGYTSSEDTVRLNLQTDFDHQDLQQRVVMTEVTPTTSEKPYYEHFNYGAPPLPAKKTGYGVETKATLNYWSELGQDYQYGTKIDTNKLTFAAPATLQTSSQDKTSKINYPVKNGNVNVPLFASLNHAYFSSGTYYHAYTWIFPHVNVEKKTGYLYLDNQVASHNVRDGGNKFYTPIWPDKKENIPMNYPVGYASNKIGVNKINVVMTDRLRIYAYMLGWMGSPTIKQDQILLVPVDEDHPFASGKPTNWTKDDIDWVKHFNP